jgi:hypothetical protein
MSNKKRASSKKRGFDINRSRVSEDTLASFLSKPLTNDLLDIPGIGPVSAKSLISFDIYTPIQLISCFLRVCGEEMNSKERCNAFWYYLDAMEVPGGTRSTIVHAIAEKVNIMIPGIYDCEVKGDDGEEEEEEEEECVDSEYTVPTITNIMEKNYLQLVTDAFEGDELPLNTKVYDSESFKLIKHLTRDAILSKFIISKGGLLYYTEGIDDDSPPPLVVSEAVLLNYCYTTDTPVSEFSTLKLIN